MPDFTFTSPDGKNYTVTGPEGATKEQAFQILQGQLSSGTAKSEDTSRTPESAAGFVTGNLAKGAVESVSSIAEKAQDVLDAPAKTINYLADKFGKGAAKNNAQAPELGKATPISPESSQAALNKAAPNLMESAEPKTPSEKYAAAALQALPSAIGGEGTLAQRAIGAVAAGVGSQAGQDIGGSAGAAVGGVAGALVGGGVSGVLGKPSEKLTEAAEQAQRSGIPLNVGEESGSKTVKQIGKIVDNVLPAASYKEKVTQTAAGINSISKIANRISQDPDTAEQLGTKLQSALKNTVNNIAQMRSQKATVEYGAVKQLAQNRPIIAYDNTVSELDKIISETKDVPSGESKRIFNQASDIRNQLSLNGKARTFGVDTAMKTRSAWSAASYGTGNIFTDVDPNLSRRFAARLSSAINKDFEAASTANTPIAQALAKANKSYANFSRSIDQVKKSALGNLLGEDTVDAAFSGHTASSIAPEKMADKFMSMKPSESKTVTAILQQHSPQVLQDTKAYVLRDLLQKSAGDTTRGELPMSFPKFLQQYKKIQPKMREMGFSDKDLADIKDTVDTMGRASDRVGGNPSGTAQSIQLSAMAVQPHLIPFYIAAQALLTPNGRALLKRAYRGSQATKYQATRALMATYVQNKAQGNQAQQ
jgi:hypothetical protein